MWVYFLNKSLLTYHGVTFCYVIFHSPGQGDVCGASGDPHGYLENWPCETQRAWPTYCQVPPPAPTEETCHAQAVAQEA